jgi:hypothetical protein
VRRYNQRYPNELPPRFALVLYLRTVGILEPLPEGPRDADLLGIVVANSPWLIWSSKGNLPAEPAECQLPCRSGDLLCRV